MGRSYTSELQDFNRGPSVVRGTTYGSHAWSGGTICGSHTWSGGTDFGGTIDGMTGPNNSEIFVPGGPNISANLK